MPLLRRQDLGSHINDSIFAARDVANALPKYRFPVHENRPEDIFQVVSDAPHGFCGWPCSEPKRSQP